MLRAGVDRAEKEIKKLPKDLKELSKYKAYELVVVNFKESLPVIVNLKNDAVKQVRDSVLKLNLNLTTRFHAGGPQQEDDRFGNARAPQAASLDTFE